MSAANKKCQHFSKSFPGTADGSSAKTLYDLFACNERSERQPNRIKKRFPEAWFLMRLDRAPGRQNAALCFHPNAPHGHRKAKRTVQPASARETPAHNGDKPSNALYAGEAPACPGTSSSYKRSTHLIWSDRGPALPGMIPVSSKLFVQ